MSKHTRTRTDEPQVVAHIDPSVPTERDRAALRALGFNPEAPSVESVRNLRASMARPMPPAPRKVRFHGRTTTIRTNVSGA